MLEDILQSNVFILQTLYLLMKMRRSPALEHINLEINKNMPEWLEMYPGKIVLMIDDKTSVHDDFTHAQAEVNKYSGKPYVAVRIPSPGLLNQKVNPTSFP
jgi:hypothetical protein